jgi:GNAT superfamily N-acetyltransferase
MVDAKMRMVLIVISKSSNTLSPIGTISLDDVAKMCSAEFGFFEQSSIENALRDPNSIVAVHEDRGVVSGSLLMLALPSLARGERLALIGTGAKVNKADFYIDSLVVAKGCRHQGIGRRLLQVSISLIPHQVIWAALWAGSDDMRPICNLLAEQGFEVDPTPRHGYWTEQSRESSTWICAACGSICLCDARIAMRPSRTEAFRGKTDDG